MNVNRVMVFDTECTGLSTLDLVIELAYIIYENEKPVETYSKLWKCIRRSAPGAQDCHKIPYQDVVNSKFLPSKEIEFFQNKVRTVDRVVAHNLKFDLKMVKQTGIWNGIHDFAIPPSKGFCTLLNFRKDAKYMFSSFKNINLFLNTGGVMEKEAHRALVDVEMTAHIYFWGYGNNGKFVQKNKLVFH